MYNERSLGRDPLKSGRVKRSDGCEMIFSPLMFTTRLVAVSRTDFGKASYFACALFALDVAAFFAKQDWRFGP